MAMMQEILTIEISLRFDNDCTATVGVGYLPTYLPTYLPFSVLVCVNILPYMSKMKWIELTGECRDYFN